MANSRKDHRPTCRLCGAKHFSHEPHAFDEPVKTTKSPKKKPVKKAKKKRRVTTSDSERVQRWREENRDKYNEYQRKLMRKRRAKS